jgi:hypothetical protein
MTKKYLYVFILNDASEEELLISSGKLLYSVASLYGCAYGSV